MLVWATHMHQGRRSEALKVNFKFSFSSIYYRDLMFFLKFFCSQKQQTFNCAKKIAVREGWKKFGKALQIQLPFR